MKAFWFTIAILGIALMMALVAFPARAEEPPPTPTEIKEGPDNPDTLKLKKPPGEGAQEGGESPNLLQPKSSQEVSAEDSSEPSRRGWGFSVLGNTPLIKENTFDARFKAFGVTGLVSIFLKEIAHRLYLHAEGGFGSSFSRFEPAGSAPFNHIFFDFPLHLRLFYPLNDQGIAGEVLVGAVLRFFQYNDDTSLLGGPLYAVDSGVFQPDFAVGLTVPVSRKFRARLLLGYIYLQVGMELTIGKLF